MTVVVEELWKIYINEKSPEIKEKLVLNYISLVNKMANKVASYLPMHILKEDLYSYGVFGLLEAIERYNPELGITFEGFCRKRIKGAIIDGIRKEDWVPVGIRKKAKLIEQAYLKLETRLNRNATDEEVAIELNISLNELYQWLHSIQFISILSLDEPITNTEDVLLKDSIADEQSPNPTYILEEAEIKIILSKAVEELPEKEKTVISLYYYHDLTNRQIAQVMNLSDSRVSQLHTKAIFRLRGKLARQKKKLGKE